MTLESSTSGTYASVGIIARGGMGEVALGVRETGTFRRLVAIKRLRPEFQDEPSYRDMFIEEAKLAGLVRHPHVVSVLDVGIDSRGPFLVMEYVAGVTASQIIKACAVDKERVPVQIVARILHQIALGLAAAHELRSPEGEELGLIHRDISPQNILVGYDGVARLTDFGIAKAHGSTKTTTGLLKGKVGYTPPERLRFERPSQQSDLFSFGVVLYEMLASARLYRGADAVEVAQMILKDPAPDIFEVRDDVPVAMVELSFELLAKHPEDRPKSASEVASRLRDIVDELAAVEGALHIGKFMNAHFDSERIKSVERTESLVRDWESSRSVTSIPQTRTPWFRQPKALGLAALLVLTGAAASAALLMNDDKTVLTLVAGKDTTSAAAGSEAEANSEGSGAAEDGESTSEENSGEELAENTEETAETAAMQAGRRRTRSRTTMQRSTMQAVTSMQAATSMAASDEPFNALEFIRETQE